MVPMWGASTAPFEKQSEGGRGIEKARKRESENEREFNGFLEDRVRPWVRVCG